MITPLWTTEAEVPSSQPVTGYWQSLLAEDDPDPEFRTYCHLLAARQPWQRGCTDELLQDIAVDKVAGVLITDTRDTARPPPLRRWRRRLPCHGRGTGPDARSTRRLALQPSLRSLTGPDRSPAQDGLHRNFRVERLHEFLDCDGHEARRHITSSALTYSTASAGESTGIRWRSVRTACTRPCVAVIPHSASCRSSTAARTGSHVSRPGGRSPTPLISARRPQSGAVPVAAADQVRPTTELSPLGSTTRRIPNAQRQVRRLSALLPLRIGWDRLRRHHPVHDGQRSLHV